MASSSGEWFLAIFPLKKDRTKDLHPSIKIMIENASASTCDKSGELCLDFISLYNSKTHGGLDIQLHKLFEDAGMGDVVFAEGVSTNLWAGNIGRAHKSAPGAFSPFSFSKMKALTASGNNRDRSLLINIYLAQKGGLMKNIDNVKASAKTTVSVPQDFHSFLFQIEAFTLACQFIFVEGSILTIQLQNSAIKIAKHNIIYKNRIAGDDSFAGKILWAVDEQVQLFLEDCRKCADREDVDKRVINFDDLHMNILLFQFSIVLPPTFHTSTKLKGKENNPDKGNGGKKGKQGEKRKSKNGKEGGGKKKSNKLINSDQLPEFKMKEGKTWEKTFQGKCADNRAKFRRSFMCPRYHMKGVCYKEGCKFSKTHVPGSRIPQDKKKEYLQYMTCCRACTPLNE